MKKLKDILKKNPEPAKAANVDAGQLGQYSAKHQVNEGALEKYLSSRGIDHEHLSTATKIAYSKSAVFLKWKRDHMLEDRTMEPSPTQKRLDKIRKSVSAHQVIRTEQAEMDEAKIAISSVKHGDFKPGQIAHHQYLGKVEVADKSGKKVYSLKDKKYYDVGHGTLSHEPIAESVKKPKPTALDKFRAAAAERAKKHAETEKKSGGMTAAIDRLQKHMNKEDVGDPLAATQSPADGANGGKEISEKKRQMSKSARIIKALYKKKGMVKEDLYDHEKEDKSVATYGKKPKFEKAEKDEGGEKKPEAAAVLSGGTTLTGEKRDDIEIDPMMRNRPGQPDVTKKDDKDKKKDGKKEEKK
jgi:hypothetical protein